MTGAPPSGVSSMTRDRMWQNSKVSPLIERVSPGVASQTPVLTLPSLAASCAQVLKAGLPAIRRSGRATVSRGANVGLGSMVVRRDTIYLSARWSIAATTVDKSDGGEAGVMALDIVDDRPCRGLRLRDARHVRCQQDLRMRPDRVARRQRLRIGYVDDRAGEVPVVECLDQGGLIELRSATHMHERRAPWQSPQQCGIDEPSR